MNSINSIFMEFMESIAAAMNLYTAASAVPGWIRSQAVPRELSERRQEVVVPRLRCSLSRCVFELWVLFVRVGVAEGGCFWACCRDAGRFLLVLARARMGSMSCTYAGAGALAIFGRMWCGWGWGF